MPEKGILTRTFARDQVPDCPGFTRAKSKLPSWDKYFNGTVTLYRKADLELINKKKWSSNQLDLCCFSGKWWKQKQTNIRILLESWKAGEHECDVVVTLGTIFKSLKETDRIELHRRFETIQTTAVIKLARIIIRVLKTWRDLLTLRLQWKTTGWRWSENLARNTTTSTTTTRNNKQISVRQPDQVIVKKNYREPVE